MSESFCHRRHNCKSEEKSIGKVKTTWQLEPDIYRCTDTDTDTESKKGETEYNNNNNHNEDELACYFLSNFVGQTLK